MAKLYNLARMTTATTGTGTITLGSAVASYLSFADAGVSDGQTVTYAIADGSNREIGRGVYSSTGPTLTRAAILDSTNAGSAINLSGAAEVFITPAAEDIANVGETNTFTAAQTFTGGAVLNSQVGVGATPSYGTAGQALLSGGAGSAPTWGTPAAAATNDIFWENGTTVSSNYTISSSKNAGTFGPVTINAGVTVTVPSGSTWTIV